jgi:hypothetical protein
MSDLKTLSLVGAAAAALSLLTATPSLAQAVIDNPGYCAQFYPDANCNNLGPGNPYTDPNYYYRRGASTWEGGQTVGVAPAAPLERHHPYYHHRRHHTAERTQ